MRNHFCAFCLLHSVIYWKACSFHYFWFCSNSCTVVLTKKKNDCAPSQVWSESSLCVQWVASRLRPKLSSWGQRSLWSDWAHMPFCWFCNKAAHIAMMDNLRQQFYPRMRQAGRDRKISDGNSHRKRYFFLVCRTRFSATFASADKLYLTYPYPTVG